MADASPPLIDPGPADLGDALAAAMRARPEGVAGRGVWWTDAVGRRHVRVGPASEKDCRLPLARLYPDRLYKRWRGAETIWLAACGCGSVGVPAALGWMGDCCGPCHDRREDRVAPPGRPAVLRGRPWWGAALAFSPDGGTLAVTEGDAVRAWDVAGGSGRVAFAGAEGWGLTQLAFAPDGETLALIENNEQQLVVAGAAATSVLAYNSRLFRPDLAFAADDLLLVAGDDSAAYRHAGEGWRQEPTSVPYFTALARDSATGAVAVSGLKAVHIFNAENDRLGDIGELPRDADFLAWLPGEDEVLAVLDGGTLPVTEGTRPEQAFICRPRGGSPAVPAGVLQPVSWAGFLAPSHDGRFIAGYRWGEETEPLSQVVFWETPSLCEVGRLAAAPHDDIIGLAFSPDGESMATVAESGVVRLWPWRRLLGL